MKNSNKALSFFFRKKTKKTKTTNTPSIKTQKIRNKIHIGRRQHTLKGEERKGKTNCFAVLCILQSLHFALQNANPLHSNC